MRGEDGGERNRGTGDEGTVSRLDAIADDEDDGTNAPSPPPPPPANPSYIGDDIDNGEGVDIVLGTGGGTFVGLSWLDERVRSCDVDIGVGSGLRVRFNRSFPDTFEGVTGLADDRRLVESTLLSLLLLWLLYRGDGVVIEWTDDGGRLVNRFLGGDRILFVLVTTTTVGACGWPIRMGSCWSQSTSLVEFVVDRAWWFRDETEPLLSWRWWVPPRSNNAPMGDGSSRFPVGCMDVDNFGYPSSFSRVEACWVGIGTEFRKEVLVWLVGTIGGGGGGGGGGRDVVNRVPILLGCSSGVGAKPYTGEEERTRWCCCCCCWSNWFVVAAIIPLLGDDMDSGEGLCVPDDPGRI
jgi:hypothetical protein